MGDNYRFQAHSPDQDEHGEENNREFA